MKETIESMIENYSANFAETSPTGWGKPLVAYARADDPLLARPKEVV